MIMAGRRQHLVAAPQHVLPHYLRRQVRIAGLGEITICCSANETAVALRIEPARRFTVRYDRSEWCALTLFAALCLLLSLSATAAALSPASTLIASATSVVTVIAIAMTFALLLSLSAAAAPAPAAPLRHVGLRVV